MKCQSVQYLHVSADQVGRRIDNFLITVLGNLPKSHLYRLIRKGEVRVNKKRIKPDYRLELDDVLRLPPVYVEVKKEPTLDLSIEMLTELRAAILFENEDLIVMNKPAGLPVHGGTGLSGGLINVLRVARPDQKFLELVHRLDKDTSGCLVIAKKSSILRELHELLRLGKMKKTYKALTLGHWKERKKIVNLPLEKNVMKSGERMVTVSRIGKEAVTEFYEEARFDIASLVTVNLLTGRTHQIRVHAAHSGHPLAGDEKYGDKSFNKIIRQKGLKRLFLHAEKIEFSCSGKSLSFTAPLPVELVNCLKLLEV